MARFVVHTKGGDTLLAGLRSDIAKAAFREVAHGCNADFVEVEVPEMAPIIKKQAADTAGRFAKYDDFTTGYGCSVNQMGPLSTRPGEEALARAIARGAPAPNTNHSLNPHPSPPPSPSPSPSPPPWPNPHHHPHPSQP